VKLWPFAIYCTPETHDVGLGKVGEDVPTPRKASVPLPDCASAERIDQASGASSPACTPKQASGADGQSQVAEVDEPTNATRVKPTANAQQHASKRRRLAKPCRTMPEVTWLRF